MRALLSSLLLVAFVCPVSALAEQVETDGPTRPTRHELILYPASYQVNGDVQNSLSASLGYVFHLRERVGLSLRVTQRLAGVRVSELTDSRPLLGAWPDDQKLVDTSLRAGSELTPFTGSGELWGQDVQLGLLVFGGVGMDHLLHLLDRPEKSTQYLFEAGWFPGAEVAVGGRIQLGQRFAIRLEAADNFTWGHEDKLNGCFPYDLAAMDSKERAGGDVRSTHVSSQCDVGFYGADPWRVPLAYSIVAAEPLSFLLHTLSLRLGVSAEF